MPVFANRLPNLRDAVVASVGLRRRRVPRVHATATRAGCSRSASTSARSRRSRPRCATATASGPATGSRSSPRTAPSGSSRSGRRSASGRSRSGSTAGGSGPEIRYGIEDSDPKVLVADAKRLARLEGEDPGVPTIVIEDDFADALELRPRRAAARRADRRGRPRGHPLHERHDRPAEGRGQHAPQHRRRARPVVLPRRADGDAEPAASPTRRPRASS